MTDRTVRLLLVEDSESDADLFNQMVGQIAQILFEVVWVTRAAAAVEKLKNHTYHAVMLDLQLPDADGLEALDLIQSASTKVPIIILTGNDDTDLGSRALKNGAHDFLVKGEITPNLLVRSIRYAADRQHLQDQIESAPNSSDAERDQFDVQIESSMGLILMHAVNLAKVVEDKEKKRMVTAIKNESESVLEALQSVKAKT